MVIAVAAAPTFAQDSSLLLRPVMTAQPMAAQQQQQQLLAGSYIYRELPPEARMRELQQHDIITVIVNYNTRMLSEGDAENRKTSTLNAVLQSWIRFDGKSVKLAPQTEGDPRVQGNYTSQYRAESEVELKDTLTFRMAARIVEIRPNGNLYIEGNQTVQNNEEQWKLFVSGEVRRESIQPDRTVSSRSIVHLNIQKHEVGQVRDGYARGWLAAWYDKFKPF